ncbi:uncharacterized protein BJX67DRAFT_355957 [Aspergillus lucknowensis]|uniref:Uncharacterized protein n=1 Tax=Aspergillus lucknowensis TaxID=176173 RepID=A0ABR4LNS6_9EURO
MQSPSPDPPVMPTVSAVGAVASPILLPLSASGPVMLNLTFSTDSPDPRASTALTVIPTVMEFDKDAKRPECRQIQPWDLACPIPLSGKIPCIYDAATQQYWLFTIEGALLLHETPKVVIPKKTARQLIYRMQKPREALVNLLNIPASASNLIPDSVILHHALHDSITVKRSSSTSPFIRFWEDKTVLVSSSYVSPSPSYLLHLRPTFDDLAPHKCNSLYHCGNNIIYCSSCTAYRLPTGVSSGSIETGPPILIGRLAVRPDIAQSIYARCLQRDSSSKKLDIDRAYEVLSQCFYHPTITSIDIPRAWMVANLLRDSLFVLVGYPPRRQNWISHFNISDPQVVSTAGGVNSTWNNIGTGVAIAGTGASVGLNVASVLLAP